MTGDVEGAAQPSTTGGGSTSAPSNAGMSGVAVRRTDVASLPDQPIDAGVVVIVPEAGVEAFWVAVGLPPAGPQIPGKAEFLVDPAVLPRGAAIERIAQGRFSSALPAGGSLFCIADDLPGDKPGPPHHVSGCARLARVGTRNVRLSSGIAGVMVEAL